MHGGRSGGVKAEHVERKTRMSNMGGGLLKEAINVQLVINFTYEDKEKK